MIIIGLVGGVACGKSFVAEQLAQLGAVVLDGDRTAHEVLEHESVKRQLVARWGNSILGSDGDLIRREIAKRVFQPDAQGRTELDFLESVTHPEIGKLLTTRLQSLSEAGTTSMVVLDAAVMMKSGWDRVCDYIAFVDAPDQARLARALKRGWTAEQFAAREAAQVPLEQKRSRADFVIDNSGTPSQTKTEVEALWHSLLQMV